MLTKIQATNMEQLKLYLQSRREDVDKEVLLQVQDILDDVKNNKDEALCRYTKKFDGIELMSFKVSESEIKQCASKADPYFVECMKNAKANIEAYHQLQVQKGYRFDKEMGIYLGQRVLALDSVGIYVPGGRAQYPSSVLMNAIPAKIAGVKRIVMITPPSKEGSLHPNIAAAAQIAGVDEIYKVGGAQGIGALTYGTETIDAVDKIVGPGNRYVATAKKLVYGNVDIDMIAGPSEILVIADQGANPKYVAADLLSQAEHDPYASAILLTCSEELVEKVNEQLRVQSKKLPKQAIVQESLKNFGVSIVCKDLAQCVDISNQIAPEHLELMVEDPQALLPLVKHAGSVFMGYYTCESIGDYFGGCNHVLPTSGTARFSSPLGVDSFIKKSSYLYYTQEALIKYGKQIITMAQEEALQAHANAVKVRVES